jgi:hypothetical protein
MDFDIVAATEPDQVLVAVFVYIGSLDSIWFWPGKNGLFFGESLRVEKCVAEEPKHE